MHTTEKLYELADAREILESWLTEHEGEWTPEIETLMTELDGKADAKIETVGLFIRETLAKAGAIKVEEDRLRDRRKAREKAAESLKNYLHREMDRLGKTKVEATLCTVAIQKSPPSVTCALDDDQLHDAWLAQDTLGEFVREVPASYRIDREAVLLAHKNGGVVPEPIMVTVGSHIRVR